MSRFITKIKDNKVGLLISFFVLFSCTVISIYAIKHYGTQYAEQKIQEQLQYSGLAPFVHYQGIHFNPFTLTPSLEEVSFGYENAPWLRFARISFNGYPLTHPSLDVDFWIKESPASSLSRDTRQWMLAAGIDTLLGKGSLLSNVNGDQVSSQFELNIKDLGIVSLSSHIEVLDKNLSMSELRTDLLASVAMGQPEGIFIIHGDTVEISNLDISYKDTGLMTHLLPKTPTENNELLTKIQSNSQNLGLTKAGSKEADQITNAIMFFLQAFQYPSTTKESTNKKLHLSMSPIKPLSLKELALMAHDDSLYQGSNMSISAQ